MSMGNIVTTHEVISDEVVAKVIGDLGKQHIEAIDAFLERDDVDCNGEAFVNDELNWSGDGAGEGMFEDDDFAHKPETSPRHFSVFNFMYFIRNQLLLQSVFCLC